MFIDETDIASGAPLRAKCCFLTRCTVAPTTERLILSELLSYKHYIPTGQNTAMLALACF